MDFLSFKTFISTEVLIFFYYLGALVMPIAIWLTLIWVIRRFSILNIAYQNTWQALWSILSRKQKLLFAGLFLLSFLFMELFWRMLFEFLIAYLQMRDALLAIESLPR